LVIADSLYRTVIRASRLDRQPRSRARPAGRRHFAVLRGTMAVGTPRPSGEGGERL